jgi:hypothetical protein
MGEGLTSSEMQVIFQLIRIYDGDRLNKMNCELMLTYDTPTLWQTGSRNLDGSKNVSHDMGYLYEACDQISDFCHH